jgi:hypothetical protein
MATLVAIASFDGSGGWARPIVGARTVRVAPSPAPQPHRVDERLNTSIFPSPYDGGEERLQILLLNLDRPDQGNGGHAGATKRRNTVAAYQATTPQLDYMWKRVTPYTGALDATTQRHRFDIGDKYKRVGGGYMAGKRNVWCPLNAVPRFGPGEPKDLFAVGCTCRDMMSRGGTHAR